MKKLSLIGVMIIVLILIAVVYVGCSEKQTAACPVLPGTQYSERGDVVVIDKSQPEFVYVGMALTKINYDEPYWQIRRYDKQDVANMPWLYAEGYKDNAFKWIDRYKYNYFTPKKGH